MKGFFGCISRLQFNRIFPLKYIFLETPDPNVVVNGTKIRARTCDIEPVTHPAEPTEIPPERNIKIIGLQNKLNQPVDIIQITMIFLISVFVAIFWLIIFLICKRIYYRKGNSYKTNEDRKIFASEVNLDKSFFSNKVDRANSHYQVYY